MFAERHAAVSLFTFCSPWSVFCPPPVLASILFECQFTKPGGSSGAEIWHNLFLQVYGSIAVNITPMNREFYDCSFIKEENIKYYFIFLRRISPDL